MLFDARNIALLAALVALAFAIAVQAQSWKAASRDNAPDAMAIALLCHGIGLGLFAQRGVLAPFLTVWAANVLILSAFSLFYLAMEKLRGDTPMWLVAVLPPMMIAIMFPAIGFSDAMIPERVVVFTVVSFAAYGIVTVSAMRAMQEGRRRGLLLIVVAMMLNLATQGARALRMIARPDANLFSSEAPQVLYYAIVAGVILLVSVGYMVTVHDASRKRGDAAQASTLAS